MSTKLHKTKNPGRPVASSINCRPTNISKFFDHVQPIVECSILYQMLE